MGIREEKRMLRPEDQKSSKYLKYLFLFCIGIAVCIYVALWHPFSSGYYSSLEITYGKNDLPWIVIRLEDRDYALTLDMGSRFPLSLSREILDKIIDKQAQDSITIHDLNGEKSQTPSYLIPKLKIGNLTLKNVNVHETKANDYSILGKFLGGEFNLLLDFPHSRIIACDTFDKLQAKNILDETWIRIPFEIHRSGIVFNVDTDFGTRRLAINTITTFSSLSSSFFPSGKSLVSSSLILEKNKFGNLLFDSIDLPEGLNEIDGFIGMDFLKEHAIYFDYSKKIAYVQPPRNYFENIPVILDSHNNPIVNVSIEDNTYPLLLDLGSSISFSLQNKVLQKINKHKFGTYKWLDYKGNQYESPLYTIPQVKISNLTFSHALAKRDDEDFQDNVSLEPLQELPAGLHPPSGMIGLPILEKYNLFLDFPHSKMYGCKDHLLLQNQGLLSENLLAISFTPHPDGIFIQVETDAGVQRLKFDTGATLTVIRAPHPSITEKFCIKGHDFGKQSIKPLDLCQKYDFDGALGMDFIKNHPIFIDYINKTIFIDLQNND